MANFGFERPPRRAETFLEVEDDAPYPPGRHEEAREIKQNAETELQVPHPRSVG